MQRNVADTKPINGTKDVATFDIGGYVTGDKSLKKWFILFIQPYH